MFTLYVVTCVLALMIVVAMLIGRRFRTMRERDDLETMIIQELTLGEKFSAYQLSEMLGVNSGVIYPALKHLEQSGEIVSEWEDTVYPRRRLYSLPK